MALDYWFATAGLLGGLILPIYIGIAAIRETIERARHRKNNHK